MFRATNTIPPENDAEMLLTYLLSSIGRARVMGSAMVELITRENGITHALNERNGPEIIKYLRMLIEKKKLAKELTEDMAIQLENDIKFAETNHQSVNKPKI